MINKLQNMKQNYAKVLYVYRDYGWTKRDKKIISLIMNGR